MKHIEIKSYAGKILRGYLHLPAINTGNIVIMFHGFTGNKTEHGGHFRDLSRLLEINNIASLRMDFSGNGESDGTFRDFTFSSMTSEANQLLDYVQGLAGIKNIILLGYSMGGALAAWLAGKRVNEISKLVLWSPAGNINEMIKHKYEVTPKLSNGDADCGSYPLSMEMYKSLADYNLLENVNNFNKPVYIIHGKKDMAVNYEVSLKYEKLYPNAVLHLIDSAGHGYDRSGEKDELLKKTYDFVR